MSSIFAGVDPGADGAIAIATSRLYAQLAQLPEPRSLAEARPTEDDYRWLIALLSATSPGRLERWLESTNRAGPEHPLQEREAAGLLLLLFAAETARRRAGEHVMWPHVFDATPAHTRDALFVQKQPNAAHKRAVEAAARRCRLRHVFGEAGTQAWYTTTFLQFGPSRPALKNVASWLVGQPVPESVERFLGDGSHRSTDFKKLWVKLRQFRLGNVSDSSIRNELRASPWILDEWIDEVLAQAKAKVAGAEATGGVQDEAAVEFLSTPVLSWPPFGDPLFRSTVQHLAGLGLVPGEYLLEAGRETTRFLINEIGDPVGEPEQLTFEAASTKHSVAAHIRDAHSGEVVTTQELMLWPGEEDVSIFQLDGHRLDAYGPMATAAGFVLIVADDLKVEPYSLPRQTLRRGFLAFRVSPDVVDETRVLLDGAVIWRAAGSGVGAVNSPLQNVSADVEPVDGKPRLGTRMRLRLHGIPGELVGLRIGKDPTTWVEEESLIFSEPFEATLDRVVNPLPVRVIADVEGELHARRLTVALPVIGAGVEDVDGWRIVRELESAENLAGRRVRLLWPPTSQATAGQHAILESGIHHVGPAWAGTRTMGELAGLGGPLGVYPSAFNLPSFAKPTIPITGVVEDTGTVLAGFAVSPPPHVAMYLRRPVEPDDDHRIVVLWEDGDVRTYSVERVWDDGTAWGCDHDRPGEVAAGLAVSYRGRRTGAAFFALRDVVALAAKEGNVDVVKSTASALRWLRAPLLSPSLEESVWKLVQREPIRVLWQWVMQGRGPAEGLRQESPSTSWLTAVRHFFLEEGGDGPLPKMWELLLKQSKAADTTDAERRILELLLEVSPAMVRRLMASDAVGPWKHSLVAAGDSLLDEAAGVVGCADTFLKAAVNRFIAAQSKKQPLEATDRANLERLLSVTAFRDYMLSRMV